MPSRVLCRLLHRPSVQRAAPHHQFLRPSYLHLDDRRLSTRSIGKPSSSHRDWQHLQVRQPVCSLTCVYARCSSSRMSGNTTCDPLCRRPKNAPVRRRPNAPVRRPKNAPVRRPKNDPVCQSQFVQHPISSRQLPC